MNSSDSNQPGTHEHEVLSEKTVTFCYRLYHYKNGLDKDVWRAKRRTFCGLYSWLKIYHFTFDNVWTEWAEWDSREDAMEFIRKDAQDRRKRITDKQNVKLRLIVREDVVA